MRRGGFGAIFIKSSAGMPIQPPKLVSITLTRPAPGVVQFMLTVLWLSAPFISPPITVHLYLCPAVKGIE